MTLAVTRYIGLALAMLFAATSVAAELPVRFVETPSLAARVAAGALPPVAERLPETPAVADFAAEGKEPGRHGGTLETLIAQAREVRMMVVYGYARLVGYGTDLELHPDILERVEVKDNRVFTLHLRPGHRWSDGHPFTSADFRYFWENVANNETLSPVGPPQELLVDGEKPTVEYPDATTVRYSWSSPNPYFLPALAGASPLFIFRPAHYLQQFHEAFADPEALAAEVRRTGARNWAMLHNRMDNQYRNDNPDLPTLDPWVAQTRPPASRFTFVRNPYYHRVDPAGRQLPYLDRVSMTVTNSTVIPAKTGQGEVDLQARGLAFSNYPFLKRGEEAHGFDVRLWRIAKGAHIALYPNLNVNDDTWRGLLRDVRFRRALSLAIDRHEINQVVYFGLAEEGQNTVLSDSPLYRHEYREAWAGHDLAAAARLLDEIGLARDGPRGLRRLPDGRPLEIIVETAGEDTEQTDVLELIHDSWLKIGVKLYSRPSQREVFRNRIFAGTTMVSVWSGYENGLPTPDTPPDELAPTSQYQLQWPRWGQYYQTGGASGEPPDLPAAKELARLNRAWTQASDRDERERIWHEMLSIHADQLFHIGLVSGVFQPIVVSRRLRNVPDEGIYNWDPGAHFGLYRPDTFWFADAVSADAASR